jgi:hypothetical protein
MEGWPEPVKENRDELKKLCNFLGRVETINIEGTVVHENAKRRSSKPKVFGLWTLKKDKQCD